MAAKSELKIKPRIETRVTRTVKTEVTLEQKQYDKILREAVEAPENAEVTIENEYGGDITITWTVTVQEDF